MKYKEWGLFFLISAIWGSSFLFIKLGLEELRPFTLVMLRLSFGAGGLWIIITALRLPLPNDWRTIARLCLLGFTNTAMPFVLITWGETHIDSGVASVLNGTVPLFSLVIAHYFLADEKMTWLRLGGLITGFLGVTLIFSDSLVKVFGGGQALGGLVLLGQLAVVIASISYAGSSVFARTQVKKVHPIVVAGFQTGSALIMITIATLVVESPVHIQMGTQTLFSIAWLGILGTCTAYLIYFHLLNVWGATRTTLLTYLMPVVGVALGAIILKEAIDWRLLAGFALIVSGIALVNWRTRRQPAPAPQPVADAIK